MHGQLALFSRIPIFDQQEATWCNNNHRDIALLFVPYSATVFNGAHFN
jgi:hypothetical protein